MKNYDATNLKVRVGCKVTGEGNSISVTPSEDVKTTNLSIDIPDDMSYDDAVKYIHDCFLAFKAFRDKLNK